MRVSDANITVSLFFGEFLRKLNRYFPSPFLLVSIMIVCQSLFFVVGMMMFGGVLSPNKYNIIGSCHSE